MLQIVKSKNPDSSGAEEKGEEKNNEFEYSFNHLKFSPFFKPFSTLRI